MMHAEESDSRRRLEQLLGGFQKTAVAAFAVRSGLLEALAGGPADPAGLARSLGLRKDLLTRALRAVVATGLCEACEAGYRLTEMGHMLAGPGGEADRLGLLVDMDQRWEAWRRLPDALSAGGPVFESVHGMKPWEYRRTHPEQGEAFNRWLMLESSRAAADIAPRLPLRDARRVADIGGGYGGLIRAVLERHPDCEGLLLELPEVVDKLRSGATGPLPPRLTLVAADFMQPLPIEADLLLLKSVLHDWEDAACARLLARCRAALGKGGRLLVIERLAGDSEEHASTAFIDLCMLLMHGGRERSLEEYHALLRQAGFIPGSCQGTGSGFHIIEASIP